MDRTYTSIADFLLDDSFCSYCLGADPVTVKKWERWLQQHPSQADMVREARALYHNLNTTDQEHQAAFDAFEARLGQVTTLNPAPVKQRFMFRPIHFAAACVTGLVAVSAAFLLTDRSQLQVAANTYDTVYTRKGEQKKVVLADNSTAMLNYNSRLLISQGYGKTSRQIILEGEAVFDVQQDAAHPFVVTAGGLRTTVLGTVFNVQAYAGKNNTAVTVLSGKVGVAAHDSLVVLPGEQVVYTNHALLKQAVNTALYADWQNGQLRFDHNAMQDIAFALENKFNVNIRFRQPEIAQELYTASFKQGMQLKEIADILCISRNIQYSLKNNELWFSYK